MDSGNRSVICGKTPLTSWTSAGVLLLLGVLTPLALYAKQPDNTACHGGNKKCQPPVPTATLSSQPASITLGQSSTLSWSSQDATLLDLEPGIGTVAAQGSATVSPQQTTTYTLTATGSGGTTTATATLTVDPPQPAGIQLSPGDDIQAAVNGNPSGTTFTLSPGTYRMQSIVPKSGDVFSGQSGAILVGAQIVGGWRSYGSGIWKAQVTGIVGESSYRGVCDPSHPACMYPEDLFYDHKPLLRVASLGLVTPGTWYLDYSTAIVYSGTDPKRHFTELSTLRSAFSGNAQNVTIQGLLIWKYASLAGDGAIAGENSSGWVISDAEFCLNHGMGLRVGTSMHVLKSYFHDNGQMGLGGSGDNILIDGNEIYKNNYAGYKWGWEAGGNKFAYTKYLKVSNNYSHDNNGPGFWTDINNRYTTYEGNRAARNVEGGIIHEISYDAIIKNNLIEDDGFVPNQTSIWYGAGIMIANSANVQIYGNTISNCMNAISGIQNSRGNDPATGLPYTLENLSVHDNVITQQVNRAVGIVKAIIFDDSVYTSWNNHFQNNTYTLSDLSHPYFYWLNQNWTYAQWLEYTSEH